MRIYATGLIWPRVDEGLIVFYLIGDERVGGNCNVAYPKNSRGSESEIVCGFNLKTRGESHLMSSCVQGKKETSNEQ